MNDWIEIKDLGLDILQWWEIVVKPGIKKLAIIRSKQMNKEKRGVLNFLLIRQAYLGRKVLMGDISKFAELRGVQMEIEAWYQTVAEKILVQSRSDEVSMNEKVRIFHHDLHKKHVRQSSILELATDGGLLEGHNQCA